MKTRTATLLTALTALATVGSAQAAPLMDYTFGGTDIGPAAQVIDNGVDDATAGSASTSTGVITTGKRNGNGSSEDSHALGLNSSGGVDFSAAAGFTATFVVGSLDISGGHTDPGGSGGVSTLTANGLFFGITRDFGTAGASLFNNIGSSGNSQLGAAGIVVGSGGLGDHNYFESAPTSGTETSVSLGADMPTDASYADGFTIEITFNDDNTWEMSSTGLDTNLNDTGTLQSTTYAALSSNVGLYVTLQGAQSSTLDMDRMTLTAVPEPSSLALLGLGGLLIARRRRG